MKNHIIVCSNATTANTLTFPTNLNSLTTLGKTFLIGTANLATLPGGVMPDFVLTNATPFLILTPGTTNTVGVIGSQTPSTQFGVYTNLPTDGLLSLQGSAHTFLNATNSPKNLEDQSNSIVPVRFTSSQVLDTNFVLSFRTATGVNRSAGPNYAVEFKTNLTDASWNHLTTVAGDGATKSVSNALSSASHRVFRLNVP